MFVVNKSQVWLPCEAVILLEATELVRNIGNETGLGPQRSQCRSQDILQLWERQTPPAVGQTLRQKIKTNASIS